MTLTFSALSFVCWFDCLTIFTLVRYNGFCKSVLWPIMHNVTSVYSTQPDLKKADGETYKNVDDEQFSDDAAV